MGWNEDDNRRKMLKRLLTLWNLVSDNTFAQVISDVFGLNDEALGDRTDEEVFGRMNDLISGRAEMIYKTKLHKNPPAKADNISAWQDFNADDYVRARGFLAEIKGYAGVLTRQEYATIKGQALHGDLDGARRELRKVMDRKAKAGEGR